MTRTGPIRLSVFLAAFALLAFATLSQDGRAVASSSDAYIVQVREGVSPDDVARGNGVSPRFVYRHAVNGFAGNVPAGRLNALRNDPRVVDVVVDREVRVIAAPDGKPEGKGKPGGGGEGQVTPANITRIGALGTGYTGSGIGIAILDTGVDLAHRDLNVGAACFDAFGGDCRDGHGHGTHVAGTTAALDNGVDVVGAAPGATVFAVKVLNDSGSGSDATIIAGLDWVRANAATYGIRVANASLGRDGSLSDNPTLHAAVQNLVAAGVVFTAAAGNDPNKDTANHIPSAYPEAIAIASTTAVDGSNQCRRLSGPIRADTASSFTTDGTKVLVSAPGEEAENVNKGCMISSVGVLSLKAGGGTTRMSGTSMAAPAVAGIAAQLVQKNSNLDVAAYAIALETGASRVGVAPLDSPTSSYTFDGEREGILNASGALARILTP